MALLALVTAVDFFENSLFIFSSSHIQGGVSASPQEFILIILAYTTTSMLVMMKQAWLAHHLGFRNYLSASLILFALGALLSGCSHSSYELMFSRAVQGLGGGALFTGSRILINLMFSVKNRSTAVRYFIIGIFAAIIIAPAIAGFGIENYSWRWVFWIVIPPAIIAAIACYLWIPLIVIKQQRGGKLTLLPLILFSVGVMLLQLSLSEAKLDLFANALHIELMALFGVFFLAWFIYHQYKHKSPIFVLHGLKNSVYLTGLGLYFLYYFLRSFSNYLFPIYAEKAQGLTLETTGLLSCFSATISLFLIIFYLRYSNKIERKKTLILIGMFALISSSVIFSFMPENLPVYNFLLPLAIKGAFGALVVIPIAGLTFSELKREHFANGYRNKNLMRQLAGSFGQTVAAIMLQNRQATLYVYHSNFNGIFNHSFNEMLNSFSAAFRSYGMSEELSHQAALMQMSKIVDKQILLLACNNLYIILAVLGTFCALIIAMQKKIN